MSEENNNKNLEEFPTDTSPENQERTPRENDSRETTQHTESWENSANLPCLLYTSPSPRD